MKVLKFGGSSVADATNISRVLDIVTKAASQDSVILVSSAIGGFTDALIGGDPQTLRGMEVRHEDIVRRLFTGAERNAVAENLRTIWTEMQAAPQQDRVTFGEVFVTTILAAKLRCDGVEALWIDSRELIRLKGGVLDREATYPRIRAAIESHPQVRVFVAPGFIASDENAHVCTLGRGGSDYSAAIFAAATSARDLQIWTDVPGIMTSNPKDVPAARTVPAMSYDAAFKLAEAGAKVLYAPAVEPAREMGIDINIRDTFHPSNPGTLIGGHDDPTWVGVALDRGRLTVVGTAAREDCEDAVRELTRNSIKVGEASVENGSLRVQVPQSDGPEAARVLHRLFFEKEGDVELYIAGRGAVGSALLGMLRREPGVSVRAIAASEAEDAALTEAAIQSPSSKRVFVDCTDSETIYRIYVPLLEAGVSVVTSNRRAVSVPYSDFARMKAAARRSGAALRYETTVGAALPMLASVRVGASASDDILSIEAVVSCTLNYVLTSDLAPRQALEQAREMGLTEKDPSLDLGGKDALRKLLIIARTAGVPLDDSDVVVEPVDMDSLERGGNLRYVASLVRDADAPKGFRAYIGLRPVDASDPISMLRGTDNAIKVRSSLHPSPTYIQGAGEGAEIAAASILNDILR